MDGPLLVKAERLKRRPIASWLGTALVQGGFIFLVANFAVQPPGGFPVPVPSQKILLAAGIACGIYGVDHPYRYRSACNRSGLRLQLLSRGERSGKEKAKEWES